ncbi:hypothetical protein CRE_17495 [Caenorhabditis remanei]|uniref:Uncharacterized protein n=1 Tax=Caenorhabditis remanei TaxID=31234 RepID=E3N7S9_CAERE|nr:hypothetical protein CRE_17495 [Caenorhabditis remanei]
MTTISGNYAAFFNWLVQDYSGDIVPTSRKYLSIKYRNEKKIECCEKCFGSQPAQKMVKILNETSLDGLQKAKVMILQSKQTSSPTDRQKSIQNNVGTKKTGRLESIRCFWRWSLAKSEEKKSKLIRWLDFRFTANQMNQGIEETSSSTSSAPAPGNNENRRIENESSATNASLTSQPLASTLSPSEIENLRKGRPYLRQITLRGPNWNLTEKERQQAATSIDHFRNLLEDLQNFFKNRRKYKLDAKLEEVQRNSADEKTSPAAIALQIPVMIQKLCKCTKSQDGLLVSSFFEDMVAFVASSRNQDVRILGKKNLGRARRALRKKMNLTVSYDDIKAAIVKFLEILAWLSIPSYPLLPVNAHWL